VFFERPDSGELAILVHMDIHSEAEGDAREFEELALSAGACPVELISGSRQHISPRYFVGTGKLEEILQAVKLHEAEVVLFNHSLTSSQERNLEKELQCRVLDRTDLIFLPSAPDLMRASFRLNWLS
jgi:GTPase